MAQSNSKRLVLLVVFIVAVGIAVFFGLRSRQQQANSQLSLAQQLHVDGTVFQQPKLIQPFTLTSTDNKPFTNASLKGHWTFLFFGFTNCPYVCPTTLASLSKMYKHMQKTMKPADLPHIVMVSVDPQRDTVKRLHSYVTEFNPAFSGARGDLKHLLQLSQQMHVVFTKIAANDGNKNHYTISHTAEIMVVDPQGKLMAYLGYPHEAKKMAHDYQAITQAYASSKNKDDIV